MKEIRGLVKFPRNLLKVLTSLLNYYNLIEFLKFVQS